MTFSRCRFTSARGIVPGLALFAFGLAVFQVRAQEAAPIPEALRDQALTVTVQTQVAESATAPAWEAKEAKSTLPGSSVSLKLVGESLVVLVQVTPYQSPEGLVLVAQAQVWIRVQDRIHYYTALNALKVGFGEPVVFYPLGEGKGKAPLRVVIIVSPYKETDPPADTVAEPSKNP